jgi:acyl-CoA reductase-like NAD-dependent aldehyde dehydrogenase
MSTERILVHSSIVTAFQEAFTQTISQLFGATSPPLAVICTASAAKNRALVSDAVQKGATVLYGDVTAVEDVETRMLPVVVGNVTKDMDIFRIESFGPTVSLYTFDTEEEAVALANDTEYGLAAAVFTEDLKAGLRVARALDSGAVHINSMTVHDEFSLPHGGCKKSGFGRFNGQMGLEEFLWTKSVTWNE